MAASKSLAETRIARFSVAELLDKEAEQLAHHRGHRLGLTRARLYFGVDQSVPTPHVDPGYLAVSTNTRYSTNNPLTGGDGCNIRSTESTPDQEYA